MLLLERKPGESLVIIASNGETIEVLIREKSRGNSIHLGIDAPRSVTIDRKEVHLRKLVEGSHK
jgi:carbon storage regulator CsrA